MPRKVPFEFAKGQLWQTDRGFVAIEHVGKRLIDYRLLKKLGEKRVRSQMVAVGDLVNFLEANAGHLFTGD